MGWLPSIFTVILFGAGILLYFYYGKNRVVRDGAIYHIFARLGQRQYDGLDIELRSILKEKGLREQDPFDVVVADSVFIDIKADIAFEEIVKEVSGRLSQLVHCDSDLLSRSFLEGTQIGATPVSHGAALPHIRIHGIQHSRMVMVRTFRGVHVDFDEEIIGEEDAGKPIFAFFFLASPEENPGQHLRILAHIASLVDNDTFIGKWIHAENEQEIKELMLSEDRYISLVLTMNSKTESLINCKIRDIELPEGSLIALIHREGQIIVPGGRTLLKEKDRLTVIGYPKGIRELYDKYYSKP
jgi:mannitol/fructose-specific phosphotransferase system IIA component (Ntr-type)